MLKRWNITIPELSGNEQRKAYIYLPESYKWQRNKRYPVLYMFDGHNVFLDSDATYGKSWGMKNYMDRTKTQLIIVAIECNHSPDNGRLKEYSPYDFYDQTFGEIPGYGRVTMNWMVKVLKPYIDKHYRTLPDRNHTFIAGSSMGGLMSLYAVLKYNRYFSRAACLSPSLWVAPEKLLNLVNHSHLKLGTLVYMDYGSNELRNHDNMRDYFADMTGALMYKGVMVESRIVPFGDHSEACWEKQLPFFMNALMYNY